MMYYNYDGITLIGTIQKYIMQKLFKT